MALDNEDYNARREAQERAMAERAGDLAARRAHLDLAKRYAERRGESAVPNTVLTAN